MGFNSGFKGLSNIEPGQLLDRLQLFHIHCLSFGYILVCKARAPLGLNAQGFTQKLECMNYNKDPPAHYHYEATKYFQSSAPSTKHQLDAN